MYGLSDNQDTEQFPDNIVNKNINNTLKFNKGAVVVY